MSDTKITTVIFDLDGTLLDTLEDLKNATNYALKTCGMPERTLEEVRRFVGNGVKQLMCRAVPGGEDNPQFERAFDIFKEYYGVHCNDTTKAYDGIPELLQELKNNGYTMAIVSNKIDSAVQDLNNRYFSQVEVAIGDRENLRRKPQPDSVFLALEELGRTKEEAVYVGVFGNSEKCGASLYQCAVGISGQSIFDRAWRADLCGNTNGNSRCFKTDESITVRIKKGQTNETI